MFSGDHGECLIVAGFGWAPGDECDAVARAEVKHRLAGPISEVVAVLHRGYGRKREGLLEVVFCDVGQSDVADLPRIAQLDEGSQRVFERHGRVGCVELVEVNALDAQPGQAFFAGALEPFRPAVWSP